MFLWFLLINVDFVWLLIESSRPVRLQRESMPNDSRNSPTCFRVMTSSGCSVSPRRCECDSECDDDDSDGDAGFSVLSAEQLPGDELLRLGEGRDQMKMSLSSCGRGLGEQQLCTAIMDNLLERSVVQTVDGEAVRQERVFQRCDSVQDYTLCDQYKKDVILASGDVKLQAVTLQGGNCEHKVCFKFSRYVCPHTMSTEGQIVILSLSNCLHLSCCMAGEQPALMLEECSEEALSDISTDRGMDRFLFYKRASGKTLISFESVKHRDWFISTSGEHNGQVEMCRVGAADRLTIFEMQPI